MKPSRMIVPATQKPVALYGIPLLSGMAGLLGPMLLSFPFILFQMNGLGYGIFLLGCAAGLTLAWRGYRQNHHVETLWLGTAKYWGGAHQTRLYVAGPARRNKAGTTGKSNSS